jgi:exonuclease III
LAYDQLEVEIQNINERYIDAYIRDSPGAQQWCLTCIYGEPRVENQHRMWDCLRQLKSASNLPWLVVGDFNEALWQEEHISCTPRPVAQMEAFREALFDCNLLDLGFSRVPYTYDNKRSGRANVKVRLDRAVACPAWRNQYAESRVQHLTSSVSDHCPLMIEMAQEVRMQRRGPKRNYEIFWERESDLGERIAMAWDEAGQKNDLGDVMKSLDQVMSMLQAWSK